MVLEVSNWIQLKHHTEQQVLITELQEYYKNPYNVAEAEKRLNYYLYKLKLNLFTSILNHFSSQYFLDSDYKKQIKYNRHILKYVEHSKQIEVRSV